MRKEVLIFGADGALGKGLSDVLISKDYDRVYLFGFKFDKKTFPVNVELVQCDDLSKEENVIKAFRTIKPDKDKNLFLYSTVGGYLGGKTTWETSESDWDSMFNINLKTSFFICKQFSLLVKECKGGSIILTSAYAALDPESGKAAYTASKRGVATLIESLAAEGININLTANAIAPYIIDTPANREWGKEEDITTWIKPSEIGELTHSIFSNFHFISGNIFKLKIRLNIHN